MEIEAKYKITGPLSPADVDQLDLAPYIVRPGADLKHHDIMLDTVERAITGSRHALRLRDENGKKILTLKGPGTVKGSVHERQEIEAPLPAGRSDGELLDYTAWPHALAAPVAQMAGLHPLAPLVEMQVHRRTWIVERDGRQVGELALDEGMIQASGKSEPVHELELELKGAGKKTDLQSLDARLRRMLPLAPEPRSKLERGLALLRPDDGLALDSAPSSTPDAPADRQTEEKSARKRDHKTDHKTDHRAMTGHTALQLAGRHTIKRYLYNLRKHEPKVRAGEDLEDVHDMRVAIRRIRSALQILEDAPDFDTKRLRKMRAHLRALARELGAVRDLDIFLGRLSAYESEHPEAVGGLRVLGDELERRREDARAKLVRELETSKLQQRLQQVEDFATQPVDLSREPRPVLVRHFAGAAIWRRYQDVLNFEGELPGAPPPHLHQLRIACKRLRYAIEMFEPALGEGAKPLTEALVAVQDHLGELQDTVVALQTAQEMREQQEQQGHPHGNHRADHHGNDQLGHAVARAGHNHADHGASDDREKRAMALTIYADTLALRRDELMASSGSLWERISNDAFRRDLAGLIAGL